MSPPIRVSRFPPPPLAHVCEGQVEAGDRGRLEVPHHAQPHGLKHLHLLARFRAALVGVVASPLSH